MTSDYGHELITWTNQVVLMYFFMKSYESMKKCLLLPDELLQQI
jgi:hypothetical protein